MFNNIKLIGVIVLSMLLFTNCKKDDKVADKGQGEIVLAPNLNIDFEKSAESNCDLPVSYAIAVVNGTSYNLPVFFIDEKITTQAIKLDAGDYTLDEFILMNDNETPHVYDDDLIVMASVNEDGEFAEFVDFTLPYNFTVEAFIKIDLYVEVVCYYPEFHEYYGFEFFTVWVTNIHEWFFYGDLCLENPSDYEGSLYDGQSEGLQADVPAIFEIEVWRNEEYITTFSNEDFLGEGSPLKIIYTDRVGIQDVYLLKLNVLVKVEDDFDYETLYEWTFIDEGDMDTGMDNVTDFVVGDCVYSETDYLLEPYVNVYVVGISTPVSVVYGGDTTFYDDGGMLIENMVTEWYEQGEDWRYNGISVWYITFLFAPDGSAEMWGTAEIFVGSNPDNPAYVGKWDLTWNAVLTPTDVGFDLLGHNVGIGVEGDVMGLFCKYTYTMQNNFSDPSTFVYYFAGYINSQVQFEL